VTLDAGNTTGPRADRTFYVRALGRMCLDFGGEASWHTGASVTLYQCNSSVAQQIGVHELQGGYHDVQLRVRDLFCIGARGGQPVTGAALELQTCNGSEAQAFALDGDSIMTGPYNSPASNGNLPGSNVNNTIWYPIKRKLVVTPLAGHTGNGTPLVLGPRELTENEYLRFYATDGTNAAPHSGFVRPQTAGEIPDAIRQAKWGAVVELFGESYEFTWGETPIGAGVTLRGYRKGLDKGPEIHFPGNNATSVFTIDADDVRITGLRLRGATRSTEAEPQLVGIRVTDGHVVTIDHNEFSDFSETPVGVYAGDADPEFACPTTFSPRPRPTPVWIARNLSHHNEANSGGYGFATWKGAFPRIQGNVEFMNRHSIAADYRGHTGYVAQDNMVLSSAATYYLWGITRSHDFDVHGSEQTWYSSASYIGGFAGDYVEIEWNTFIDDNRVNIKIRGQPCRPGIAQGNVFTGSAPTLSGVGSIVTLNSQADATLTPVNFTVASNDVFGIDNPTGDLAVGDFDGDGVDDVFLGTGAGWFYSSGGKSEWRFLRRAPELATSLRFGDLDGDGRTDVITVHRLGAVDVSWGGVSSWQALGGAPAALPISSFVVGEFDGDAVHGADLFMTDGANWFVAPSGRNWVFVNTSSYPMSRLRFGDFDRDGKTDVFAINDGKWSISSAARTNWISLNGPSTSNLDGVIVGDFDGDGIADVGRVTFVGFSAYSFQYSRSGRDDFGNTRFTLRPVILSGRFEGGVRSDVLWWSEFDFMVAPGPSATEQTWSRQDMR
jgi:FG-GAP-like repeat